MSPSPVLGGNTGGSARSALSKLINEMEHPQQIRNWTQFQSPIVNRRDSSIIPIIDIGSSRHTEMEQQIEFSIRLRYTGEMVLFVFHVSWKAKTEC